MSSRTRCAVIVHPLVSIGGGEKVALEMVKVLLRHGYRIRWLTTPFNQSLFSRMIELLGGSIEHRIVEFEIVDMPLSARILVGKRLRWLAYYRHMENVLLRENECITIDTRSNLPLSADIVYIHYPMIISMRRRNGIYEWLVKRYYRRLKRKPGIVLANSRWTANVVEKVYGVRARVLYPPVDVDYFSKAYHGEHSEKMVLTVTRLGPEKNLERIVDVAARLPEFTFVIAGISTNQTSTIIDKIMEKSRRLGARNVVVAPDIDRGKLLELMAQARYYLHPEFPEHFGIAIVEAMAAGLVPIVYRDGGGWHDVVSRVSRDLGYRRIEEAVEIIRSIEEKGLWPRLSREAHLVSLVFSSSMFRRVFSRVVNSIAR